MGKNLHFLHLFADQSHIPSHHSVSSSLYNYLIFSFFFHLPSTIVSLIFSLLFPFFLRLIVIYFPLFFSLSLSPSPFLSLLLPPSFHPSPSFSLCDISILSLLFVFESLSFSPRRIYGYGSEYGSWCYCGNLSGYIRGCYHRHW